MCGISVYINFQNAFENIKKSLKIIENRGKDRFGIYDLNNLKYAKSISKLKSSDSKTIFAHNLHKIVGNIKQPLLSKNKRYLFLSNQEIYNWKEISKKEKISSKNDTDLLFKLLIKDNKINLNNLDLLKGIWSFVLYDIKDKKIYACRDIIGIKPLWYYYKENKLAICSEKKGLINLPHSKTKLLNPRHILLYNLNKNKLDFIKRKFKPIDNKNNLNLKENTKKLHNLLKQSIKQRIPNKKFALLFSGGIDSLVIAKILKDLNYSFDLYFSYIKDLGQPKDLKFAKKAAKHLDLNLIKAPVTKKEYKPNIKKIINTIESSDPIKVGVASPIYFASKKAKENKVKVIFSGLGADEIFAGYNRFKKSKSINKDSYSLLLEMHEQNLYRDDVITMHNNIELRLPYLDLDLINFSFKINKKQKINSQRNKIILRNLAKLLDLPKRLYNRPKKAAQYGSNFDKAIIKLSKENNFKSKSKFLNSLTDNKNNINLGCLYSGGKDSNLAFNIAKKRNYKISCLLSILPDNKDSYMFQKPNIDFVKLQAKALNTPLLSKKTKGEKEKELKDLKSLIKKAKKEYNIQGIVCGALFSNYQRTRIQKICDDLQLRLLSPLWNTSQESEIKTLLNNNFTFIICKIAALGLNKKYLGKIITKDDLNHFKKLNKKHGFNIAGEGGEYETLVLDSPNFSKKIKILNYKKILDNKFTGYIDIRSFRLISKK